ncbi:SET domain-containing protein [Guyanagaster necrorhizus]|uniref:SET domain-containing protein n=1 Tax=Guyanagaster necrorhizus TaxID=856835 RepID=A0A9P8ATG4_9AGAR|nr:SET domain-containing protein [Guyanagaster necrorhizus MCA 3950]KAG7447170.1 SET domain-containing protein [Guyanagaster necrorhizus MCA 3950]
MLHQMSASIGMSKGGTLSLRPSVDIEETNKLLTDDLSKGTDEMMKAWGLTDDDLKGFAPVPDENDPGPVENETPHADDETWHDLQVPFPGGWSQCLLSGYLKRRLEHISRFPRPLKETEDKAYLISSAPGKGLGMFAARKIKMGDLIADERPLMVVPLAPVGIAVTPIRQGMTKEEVNQAILDYSEGIMRPIFERLHDGSQKEFMKLHNSHLHDGSGPVLGVIRTNGYGLGDQLKDDTKTVELLSKSNPDEKLKSLIGKYSSVHNILSRVNHSCSPNTNRKFHMSTFSMQLRAARDIEEGEEILTSYTNILQPAADRAKDLAPYGIQCTCRACLDCTKSDPIRAAVFNRSGVFVPMMREPGVRSDAWIDPALETLARIEEEELQGSPEYHKTLHQLYNAYVYQNDEKKALVYGEKLWVATLAAGEKQYETFRNPELMKKSPQWMMAKMTRGIPLLQSFF